jgi:hypothetical protein
MDLSRVFGDQNQAPASAGWNGNLPMATFNGDEAQAFQDLYRISHSMQDSVTQLQAQLSQLNQAAENVRAAFNAVCSERDALRQHVQNASRRLGEVQRVVSRYAVVEDPVVASDGFTYERKVIEAYLAECRESKSEGISQQTKEVLSNTLLANQSLRKLVDLLKTVKPEMLGPVPKQSDALGEIQARAARDEEGGDNDGTRPAGDGRLHPCVRVYGFCNYKESCTYANYPYDACLSHLKGKCRFGSQCHEHHVDLKRPAGQNATAAPRAAAQSQPAPRK